MGHHSAPRLSRSWRSGDAADRRGAAGGKSIPNWVCVPDIARSHPPGLPGRASGTRLRRGAESHHRGAICGRAARTPPRAHRGGDQTQGRRRGGRLDTRCARRQAGDHNHPDRVRGPDRSGRAGHRGELREAGRQRHRRHLRDGRGGLRRKVGRTAQGSGPPTCRRSRRW